MYVRHLLTTLLVCLADMMVTLLAFDCRLTSSGTRDIHTERFPQPLVLTWAVNNQGGALKRGTGSAIVVSMGNAGGIISSL